MTRELAKSIAFFLLMALTGVAVFAPEQLNNPIFLAIAVGVIAFIAFLFTITTNQVPTSDIHGSARWATAKDLKKKELVASASKPPKEASIILGPSPFDHTKRIDLPEKLTLRHVLMLGSTGSGKGRGFFLWQLSNFNGSFVYCDPKGEGWDLTSGYRKHSWRFAPREPDNSLSFNWIPLCRDDAHLCLTLALAVVTSSGAASSADAQFWVDAGSQYLAALFAHTATFEHPTPAAAYDFATSFKGEELVQQLLKSPNPIARQYATLFSAADPKLRGNVMIGANAKLIWLGDEKVRRFTSSSIKPPDFSFLRKHKTGVYWVLSEKDVTVLKPLSTLFFTLVLYQLKEGQSSGKVSICMFLDELANIGRIPGLEVEIAILRGRKVGLALGVQSLEQLDNVYGKDAAKVIAGNCITKIILGGLVDYYTLKYVSDLLGTQTISELSTSKSKQPGLFGKITTSEQIVKTQRPLMTPDEVRRLKTEKDGEQLIICDNEVPFITRRYFYDIDNRTAKASSLGDTLTMNFSNSNNPVAISIPANKNAQIGNNENISKNGSGGNAIGANVGSVNAGRNGSGASSSGGRSNNGNGNGNENSSYKQVLGNVGGIGNKGNGSNLGNASKGNAASSAVNLKKDVVPNQNLGYNPNANYQNKLDQSNNLNDNNPNNLDNQKAHKTPSIDTVFYAEKQSIPRNRMVRVEQPPQPTQPEQDAPFSC
jgi:type IV secretion system protein VirD4